VEGNGVFCLEGLDRRALEGLRKTMNNRTHVRRSPGRDSKGDFRIQNMNAADSAVL